MLKNRAQGLAFCNRQLKRGINIEIGDLVYLSEPTWLFLFALYGGEELRRYSVQKNASSVLLRSPELPNVQIALVIQAETIRGSRSLSLPRKCQMKTLKAIIHESMSWLKQLVDQNNMRLWKLLSEARDADFISQYNE